MAREASAGRVLKALAPYALVVVSIVVVLDVVLHRLGEVGGMTLAGEHGHLEILQVVCLVVLAALGLYLTRRRPATRPLSQAIVGLALALLVREHNNDFKDNVGKGVWQGLVALVLLSTAVWSWRDRNQLGPALLRLCAHPAMAWFAAAASVFLCAQLFDERSLWTRLLAADEVPYAARRITEEGFELVGYLLALVGMLRWTRGPSPDNP